MYKTISINIIVNAIQKCSLTLGQGFIYLYRVFYYYLYHVAFTPAMFWVTWMEVHSYKQHMTLSLLRFSHGIFFPLIIPFIACTCPQNMKDDPTYRRHIYSMLVHSR
jgi:hypothetical protein